MPKVYEVTFQQMQEASIFVLADSPDDARKIGQDEFDYGSYEWLEIGEPHLAAVIPHPGVPDEVGSIWIPDDNEQGGYEIGRDEIERRIAN